MTLKTAALLTVLTFCVGLRLTAQSTFGSIVGVVSDTSSSAVPGAIIQVTNVDDKIRGTVLDECSGRL